MINKQCTDEHRNLMKRSTSKEFEKEINYSFSGVLDGYHINPLGESDMTDRSRISMLSTEMLEAKQIGVRGLSCYGFRLLDGSFL